MPPSTVYCDNCGAANRPSARFCVSCGKLQTLLGGQANSSPTGLLAPHHPLKQRYRIIDLLGQGGFGAVYKAEDMFFGNALRAVKEMRQSGLSTQELKDAIDAFKREAVLLAGLMHPNLPRIYDHFNDGGRWYLVMDCIEGDTLEDHLQKANSHRLPINEILHIGEQLCSVLDYLHNRQPPIIFRDLKPTNIMLTADGHIYLIDFGIARLFKSGQIKDTISLGSPGYAAPEQYGKAQTTVRSDIYSLGATLHQLLTGIDPSVTPFTFSSIHSSLPQTPPELEKLIMQMVELDEKKRPSSMSTVKDELQRIAASLAKDAILSSIVPNALPYPVTPPGGNRIGFVAPASPSVPTTPNTLGVQSTLTSSSQQYSGYGQQVSPKFKLRGGLVVFYMTHNGRGNFHIWLLDDKGTRIALLVNKTGNFDGAKAVGIKSAGAYLLDIAADGDWTVKVDQ